MTETIKLYDSAPYDTEFTAAVVSIQKGRQDGTCDVVLDRTLFFPEEGGQTCDRGTLNGVIVTDVQIKNGIIIHTIRTEASGNSDSIDLHNLEHSPVDITASIDPADPADSKISGSSPVCSIKEGSTVTGVIDWAHRYSNMQNHSGEHILSGLLHNIYGYENVGFRLSDNTVTLDTSGQLDDEQIQKLETKANEVVWSNVPITCRYPSKEELSAIDYRSKKEIDGAVRIVTIEGVDVCACCAPHVKSTGEIGLIKILSVIHNKSDMRLTIACGKRALLEIQQYQKELEKISHYTSEPVISASKGTERLLSEITALRDALKASQDMYVRERIRAIEEELCSETASPVDKWVFEKDLAPLCQRQFMNLLCDNKQIRFAGVFTGSDETGWKYLIGSRSSDARIPNAVLKEKFGARGGGKSEMVQGSLTASKADIAEVLNAMNRS